MSSAFAYFWVSTQRQSQVWPLRRSAPQLSDLPKRLALSFFKDSDPNETDKGSDALDRRPQFAAALAAARQAKCPVLMAKLDRLSRMSHSSQA